MHNPHSHIGFCWIVSVCVLESRVTVDLYNLQHLPYAQEMPSQCPSWRPNTHHGLLHHRVVRRCRRLHHATSGHPPSPKRQAHPPAMPLKPQVNPWVSTVLPISRSQAPSRRHSLPNSTIKLSARPRSSNPKKPQMCHRAPRRVMPALRDPLQSQIPMARLLIKKIGPPISRKSVCGSADSARSPSLRGPCYRCTCAWSIPGSRSSVATAQSPSHCPTSCARMLSSTWARNRSAAVTAHARSRARPL